VGHRACKEKENTMTLLDVLIGLVAIAIGFAGMASICFLSGAIFYYFYNNRAEPVEEVVFKKRKTRKTRKTRKKR